MNQHEWLNPRHPGAGTQPPVTAPAPRFPGSSEPASPPPGPASAIPVHLRLARLAGGVDRSRRRRQRGSHEIRKVMHVLGVLAIGLGLAAVVLGWYGAAHSPDLSEEIPYLISGGLFGVALASAGGMLFVASWTVRQIEEGHRDTHAVVRSLERINHTLISLAPPAPSIDDEPIANGSRMN